MTADTKARRSAAGRKGAAARNACRDPRARQLANLKRAPRGSGLGTVAARLAREQGVSLTIAAELVGVARQTVHGAWRALFGSEPTPRTASRRKARASEVRS